MHSLLLLLLARLVPLLISILCLNQLFAYIFRNTAFIIPNLQKNFHEDNLSFVCFQFDKRNRLNTLANNLFSCTSKGSIETTVKNSHSTPSPGAFNPRKFA